MHPENALNVEGFALHAHGDSRFAEVSDDSLYSAINLDTSDDMFDSINRIKHPVAGGAAFAYVEFNPPGAPFDGFISSGYRPRGGRFCFQHNQCRNLVVEKIPP